MSMSAGGVGEGIERALAAIVGQARSGPVVDLRPPDATLGLAALAAGLDYVGVCDRATVLAELQQSGLHGVQHDLADLDALDALLEGLGEIRALALPGTLGRAAEPERLLRR